MDILIAFGLFGCIVEVYRKFLMGGFGFGGDDNWFLTNGEIPDRVRNWGKDALDALFRFGSPRKN
jgi:hypothetical protein